MAEDVKRTDSGIEIAPLYSEADLAGWSAEEKLGVPGGAPYTRGVYPTMYRGKLWTMRQYAGFGSAETTNQRFKFLLDAGQTGLSCAFDLPTQMGYDSDHPRSEGEIGKVGVAIDSLEDMRLLLKDLPLDKVSTSMTINSTGAILLLMYELVAEEQGVPASAISGTIQNDLLKEYIARGTYVYPPRPSMRLITDIFAYCSQNVPKWNTISISGYHIREAGSTAVHCGTACFADVISRNRDRVPLRNILRAIRKDVGDQAHRRTWWVHVGTARDVFLQQVILNGAANRAGRNTLLFCNQFVHQQQDGTSGVDGHRRRHLVERQVLQQQTHVLQRVNGNTDLADFAFTARVI